MQARRSGYALALAALLSCRAALAMAQAPTDSTAQSAPPAWSASGDVTFASRYLFQGLDYSEGRSVLQPELVVGRGPFSFTAWANYRPDAGQLDEIDLALKMSHTWGKATISPGYTALNYPNRPGWTPSQELVLDSELDTRLHPSLSLHFDVDSGKGLYATLGASQELPRAVTAGVNLFYQDHYYGLTGVPAAELKVSGAWSLGAFSWTPSISRIVTWHNGNFRDADAVASTWLFALNMTRAAGPTSGESGD